MRACLTSTESLTHLSFQKSPLKPSDAKSLSTVSIAGLDHSGAPRSSANQALASLQACSISSSAPRGIDHCRHQRSTCSSDLKSSIVFQVKTTSCHQRAAGTAKWMTSVVRGAPSSVTSKTVASPQQPQALITRAGSRSMIGTPSASQAQFA